MKIEVLGPGCSNCKMLHERTLAAVGELGLDCEVEKVSDMQRILAYGVMTMPVLVVDGQVKLAGRVPSATELKTLLG